MIKELIRDIFYVLIIFAVLFVFIRIGMVLEYIMYRIEIQKSRADKIELFLEHKYTGEYSAKAPH